MRDKKNLKNTQTSNYLLSYLCFKVLKDFCTFPPTWCDFCQVLRIHRVFYQDCWREWRPGRDSHSQVQSPQHVDHEACREQSWRRNRSCKWHRFSTLRWADHHPAVHQWSVFTWGLQVGHANLRHCDVLQSFRSVCVQGWLCAVHHGALQYQRGRHWQQVCALD